MRRRFCRPGYTLIELLLVIAVIAILIALLVPAVQRVREASANLQCKNNLRQIALATLQFYEDNKAFPPARIVKRPLSDDPSWLRWGGVQPSWLVRILPYLDQQSAFEEWDVNKPYDDHPDSARLNIVPTYLCPTRRTSGQAIAPTVDVTVRMPCGCVFHGATVLTGATGDYAGNHGDLSPGTSGLPTDFYWGGYGTGVIISSRGNFIDGRRTGWIDRIRIADIVDGTSNTFLVGEMHVPVGMLASGKDNGPIYNGSHFYSMTRVGGPGVPLATSGEDLMLGMSLFAFGSWHPGVCNFAFADGRVVAISVNISTTVLERLCNRADEEPVPDFDS